MKTRRRTEEEPENHERWLVSYADFITLLFAFFTVMYATSTKDFDKEKQFEQSIKKAFAAIVTFGGQQGEGDFPKLAEDVSVIAPPIEVFRRKAAGPGELLDAVERELDETVSKEEQQALGLELRQDSFGVKMTLDSAALFDSGSANMKREVLDILTRVSIILKKSGRNLMVEGHTDDQPIKTAVYPSNWELAAARASTIVRYLIKAHGIEASKLSAISMADQRPIAENTTPEGRAKNRRIEILLATRATPSNP